MSDTEPKIITHKFIPIHKAKFINGEFVEIPDDPEPIFVIDEIKKLHKQELDELQSVNHALQSKLDVAEKNKELLAEQYNQMNFQFEELQRNFKEEQMQRQLAETKLSVKDWKNLFLGLVGGWLIAQIPNIITWLTSLLRP